MRPSELFTQITRLTGLYNIQTIDNIPSIMQRGLLSHEKSSKILCYMLEEMKTKIYAF